MLDFLLTVEHLPAFDAEDLSIRLLLDHIEFVDEDSPLWRVTLNHFFQNLFV